jgi:hypothetical protein
MLLSVRTASMWIALFAAAMLLGCGSSPPAAPAAKAKVDPTTEPWYGQSVQELTAMARQADQLLQAGQREQAAAVITNGQPLLNRLLSAPRPTLEAMEAVSDFDQLYAQMLVGSHYYGSARMLFQKNVTRWKTWKPSTPETERRLKLAMDGIAECDRHMGG